MRVEIRAKLEKSRWKRGFVDVDEFLGSASFR